LIFLTVTLPLALLGDRRDGAVLRQSAREFGATITFVSNIPGETQTISAAIYTYTQIPNADAAALRPRPRRRCHLTCRPRHIGMVRAARSGYHGD
jgi:ABC-type molybdate transport system permease subunit